MILTAKDVSKILNVSIRTAYRYMKDIREEYKVKKVSKHALNRYFHLESDKSSQ